MEDVGEHLLPGKLGPFFAILSFVAYFVALIAYYKTATAKSPEEENSWRRMARAAFGVDVLAVFCGLFIIIYLLSNHLFYYNIALEHSNRSLTAKYLLA